MAKVVSLINPEREAKHNFCNHVQSVAFSLSLSKKMIDMLVFVRDYGFPDLPIGSADRNEATYDIRHSSGANAFVPMAQALSRRGLVIHRMPTIGKSGYWEPDGKKLWTLSRAGELTCELLVEAGLIPAAVKQPKKQQAL